MRKKKVIKRILLIILLIILMGIGFLGYLFYDGVRVHANEIDLGQITEEEKEKLINLNFLELSDYPSSIEFLSLKEESAIRETQFYLDFSVAKEEASSYQMEKNENASPNEISILKIGENEDSIIYEMQTNFAQHSTDGKWKFLYALFDKYGK